LAWRAEFRAEQAQGRDMCLCGRG